MKKRKQKIIYVKQKIIYVKAKKKKKKKPQRFDLSRIWGNQ